MITDSLLLFTYRFCSTTLLRPAFCHGQTHCHSGEKRLCGSALASRKLQVHPQKPPQINKLIKTINMLWEKLFNFLSASLWMKRWETGHLPNPPASCLKFSSDDEKRKKYFISLKISWSWQKLQFCLFLPLKRERRTVTLVKIISKTTIDSHQIDTGSGELTVNMPWGWQTEGGGGCQSEPTAPNDHYHSLVQGNV